MSGPEGGNQPDRGVTERSNEAFKDLDKHTSPEAQAGEKAKVLLGETQDELQKYLDTKSDSEIKKIGAEKIMAKGRQIFDESLKAEGIKLNDRQQAAIDKIFVRMKDELFNHVDSNKSLAKADEASEPKVDEKKSAAPKEAEVKKKADGTENLKTMVEKEKENIIPRNSNGQPSNFPDDSFDANKIPKSTKTMNMKGVVVTGETAEGRNEIAQLNIMKSAKVAQERAKIIESKGKRPEDLSKEDRADAEIGAAKAFEDWAPDKAVVDKYLIKDKSV